MSDEHIIRYCAPTLASMKTGSLFTCPFEGREAMMEAAHAVHGECAHLPTRKRR